MRGFQGLDPELSPLRNEAPPLVDSLSKTKNIVVVKTRAEALEKELPYQNPGKKSTVTKKNGLYSNTPHFKFTDFLVHQAAAERQPRR